MSNPARNGEYRFLRTYVANGMVVLDVGANVGGWTEYLLSLGKNVEVHCFEPVPSTFEELRRRLCDRVEDTRVVLNNVGLSDRPEIATIKVYGQYAGSNSLYERRSALATHPCFTVFSETEVRLMTLDAYLERKAVDRVDLLKIDVEGHEEKALRGASASLSRGTIRCIQFEYGGCFLDSGATLEEVFELLSRHGYEMFRLSPWGKIHVSSFRSPLENYQHSNWVAMAK